MKSKHLKTILNFLKRNKQINKSNVSLLDKEITEKKIYELRTYTEGSYHNYLSVIPSKDGQTKMVL